MPGVDWCVIGHLLVTLAGHAESSNCNQGALHFDGFQIFYGDFQSATTPQQRSWTERTFNLVIFWLWGVEVETFVATSHDSLSWEVSDCGILGACRVSWCSHQ